MAKMRHNCDSGNNCYLEKLHAPIHIFDDCFGGKIEMSDVDGVVERNGRFLYVEWKSPRGEITKGQDILLQQWTKCKKCKARAYVVECVVNPTPDSVCNVTRYAGGTCGKRNSMKVSDLIDEFSRWYKWADRQSRCP